MRSRDAEAGRRHLWPRGRHLAAASACGLDKVLSFDMGGTDGHDLH